MKKFLFIVLTFIGGPASAQAQFTQPTRTHLMHSSGLHLKRASDGIAKLEASKATLPQQITFVPMADGYYVVRADGNKTYMALQGDWDTYFVADSTSDNAKWMIEDSNGIFVKLKNKKNGKYLGTDANTAESWVFADKDGNSPLHWWFFSDDPAKTVSVDTLVYTIRPNDVRQQFDGWGVSLCWWANMCGKWSDANINTLVNWLVSPTGLNYSHFRYNIGGGDDPNWTHCTPHHMKNGMGLRAEMPGFKDSTDDKYHWDRDEAQRKIMLKIREKRPDAVFEAFSNSAPYYMTYSGCVSGNTNPAKDNLRPEYYEEFAHYLVDVCKHYKDEYNIEFHTLEPFNEAETALWGAGGAQEGCHFDVQSQINFLKVLAPILQESGLKTVISASDETHIGQSVTDFKAYQKAGVLPLIGQWNTHTYHGSKADRQELARLAHQENIHLWMSEVEAGGSGLSGNLALTRKLFDDMRYLRPETWIDWQVMEEWNDQWCTVTGNFAEQTFSRNKNYYVRQQCSRFIRNGYNIVTSDCDQSLAATNAAGDTLVLVVLNESTKTVHRVYLDRFSNIPKRTAVKAFRTSTTEDLKRVTDFIINDNILTITLPEQSITTLILPIQKENSEVPIHENLRSDIYLSDPFIMADPVSKRYYMTGTGGALWVSDDLETWTNPQNVIDVANKGWFGAQPAVWASEIHYADGKYYYISTFTNDGIQVDGNGHPRRAVHLLSSTLPQGKYTLIHGGDATYLPAEKTTLDGTLFTDTDGKRYLLYCHEWIQNGNGTIEYIELKPDMSGTIGEGVVMTRAHDASWNTSPVTDGPYLFRTQTGRLGMIWTSWHGDRYVQGVAYSTSGKLAGPWKHESLPITPDNYGHGMLFRTFDGQLLMSIHSHRNIDMDRQIFERHPVLFVMDDSGDQLRTVMEYKRNIGAGNPAKVMVDNPEFEYGKQGWTCTTGAQNQLIAHNQSGAITGDFFESWDANSFTGEIYQEKAVPNGTYWLTAAAFRSQLASGGKQDAETVWLFANEEKVLVDNTTPQNYTVTVCVTDGHLRFGLRSTKKNFRWMGIDNVILNYYGEEQLTADDIEHAARNQDIYLCNQRDDKFLNAGQSWGTQAVLSNHPLDFRLVPLPNGKYAIDSRIDNGGGNHYAGTNGYLDGQLTPFTVNWTDSNSLTISADGTHYWGSTGATVVNTTLAATAEGAKWNVLHRDDLIARLSEATPDAPADATFLIQCPGFGRNDSRVSAWTVSDNCTNSTLSGGNDTNNCAESYHSPFTISQVLRDAPEGTYTLTAQGFYRQDDGREEQLPMFFIGSKTATLSRKSGSENSMSDASASFTARKYTCKPITFYYNGNSKLTLGIRGTATSQWVVWDNFQLTYLGKGNSTGIGKMEGDECRTQHKADAIYDLNGRRVSVATRGIYIRNGKKTVF